MTEKNDNSSSNGENTNETELYFPRRFIVVVLCWSGLLLIHAMRVNISITVVTILDNSSHTKVGSREAQANLPNVSWNSQSVGILHSIFYIGFIISQIPGGYISGKYEATRVFGLGIVLSSTLNMLLPVGIHSGNFIFTCCIRFSQGLMEGLVFPALYRILHLWFPNKYVHKYGGWIFGGMYAGPIIGFSLDGFIVHYWKWSLVFYLHSVFGLIWFIFWYVLIYENPASHPSISYNELQYITSHQLDKDALKNIPWKKIFTSSSVWAIIACNFAQSWMFILMLTNEPLYLNQFNFQLIENGIFSAIPHILKVIVASLSGYIADCVLNSNKLSRTNVRKLFNSLGFGIESIMCYFLVFANTGTEAVIFLCIGIGFSGLTVSGWQINFLDISPEFAGILAGISATFGMLGGILSPVIIGFITQPQTLSNWQYSFILTASVIALGSILFAVFSSAENQNWNLDEGKMLLEEK